MHSFCRVFRGAPSNRLLRALFLATLFMVAAGPNVAEAKSSVLRATLHNGLRVIIVRNTLAPVVATSVNYLVGSDEAPRGFPGMAHAQEHMMFRGSPGLSANQLAAIGSVMGGDFNANTRESMTQYLFTVPAEDLNVALHIEAIRMSGVLDSQKQWAEERGAIEQEVARDMSSPDYVLYSKLRAILFAGTPYQHDALGTRPSFNKTTGAMLQKFYDTWYAPNNAILIVVGDINPQKTLATIKRMYGKIKPKQLPKRPAVHPRPVKPTSIHMNTDRPNGTQMLAMRLPGLNSPDFPALEVLSDVLNSHRFALYGLVPAGKALNAYFELDPMPKASLGYAAVSFNVGTNPKSIEADMRKILEHVVKHGVPPALVKAAKMQERRQAEFQKNSIAELASVWSDAVALYGLRSPDEDLQRIDKVTVADVNRVARKYLDLNHAVSATMIPHGSGRPVPSSGGFGGQESITLAQSSKTRLPAWAEKALKRLTVPPSTIKPVVSKLSNGITLIVQPEDVSNTVSVYGHIKNREDVEAPPGQDGVGTVLEQLFEYGTKHLDRVAFQRALDDIGAQEQAGTSFSVEVLANDFDRGVQLLADNELHPALPKKAFDTVRYQYAHLVAVRNQSPSHFTRQSLVDGLFPKHDPSQRYATEKSINSLSLAKVQAYYKHAYRPDLTTIVVIGKISPKAARRTIEKYFGSWSAKGSTPNTELPAVPPNKPSSTAVPDASRVQDIVVLANAFGLTRTNPDYYPLRLGDAVLGGSFYSTRLSIDLRKNTGLVYSVGSFLQVGKTRSVYFIEYACDPQNVSKASHIVVRDLKQMQTQLVPKAELNRAKALLLRQIPLGESSVNDIASGLISRHELGLPLDEPTVAARHYIALNAKAVRAAFKKWIRPDDLVQVSQGPNPK